MPKPRFIYINGYPGVGKLTVARALWCVHKHM
jgi:broad-specificity NMP kinase